MIEQAVYQHLISQESLEPFLATYAGQPAVFNQEAPADTDALWGAGSQYGRIVFYEDLLGDPERTMGGTLSVDIQCKENEQYPEQMEPLLRALIHGYFFSNGTFTVEAQWKNSSYFTEPTDRVNGVTITFDILAFPILTTSKPDVIARINEWTAAMFPELHVINYEPLPSTAWKPDAGSSAVYWRVQTDNPARWIPDTFQTIWRTANLKGHIFSQDVSTASIEATKIITKLYAVKRLIKDGETPIMTNRQNTADNAADPLKTGQISVESTYGIIVYENDSEEIDNIKFANQNIDEVNAQEYIQEGDANG